MMVNMAIIGIGQIGGSVGFALADHADKVYRIGYDKQKDVSKRAEKSGALDIASVNLVKAVENADIILLAVPFDQVKITLELISPYLKDNAVLMDTCPVKTKVFDFVNDLLPAGRYYIGLTPVLNSAYLHSTECGFSAAHCDLFKDSLMGIVAPQHTPAEVIKLATDLVTLLKAQPYFLDQLENDGLMSAIHILPQLLAVAMMFTTCNSPGWSDAKKIAGRFFADTTRPLMLEYESGALSDAFLASKENITRLVDSLMKELGAIKDTINSGNETDLNEHVAQAIDARANWWIQRQRMSWTSEDNPVEVVPTSKEMLGRLIGYRPKDKRK